MASGDGWRCALGHCGCSVHHGQMLPARAGWPRLARARGSKTSNRRRPTGDLIPTLPALCLLSERRETRTRSPNGPCATDATPCRGREKREPDDDGGYGRRGSPLPPVASRHRRVLLISCLRLGEVSPVGSLTASWGGQDTPADPCPAPGESRGLRTVLLHPDL
jgi:hypothetical protein